MKQLLITTIAAVLLVGCGEPSDFHKAAREGNIEAVKQFIAAGADVNAKEKDWQGNGWTPLHKAAYKQHKDVAELLIAAGADVNAKAIRGITPLTLATSPFGPVDQQKYKETVDLLRKHGAKTTEELIAADPVAEVAKPEPPTAKAPDISIHDAVESGNIEVVKQHIAAGVDVNAKEEFTGDTLLHYAARKGHKEIVELLIAEGADVNAKEIADWTPLYWAALNGHKEVVELLIAKGADVNTKHVGGQTPLDSANDETADLLRKHGGKTAKELKAEGK